MSYFHDSGGGGSFIPVDTSQDSPVASSPESLLIESPTMDFVSPAGPFTHSFADLFKYDPKAKIQLQTVCRIKIDATQLFKHPQLMDTLNATGLAQKEMIINSLNLKAQDFGTKPLMAIHVVVYESLLTLQDYFDDVHLYYVNGNVWYMKGTLAKELNNTTPIASSVIQLSMKYNNVDLITITPLTADEEPITCSYAQLSISTHAMSDYIIHHKLAPEEAMYQTQADVAHILQSIYSMDLKEVTISALPYHPMNPVTEPIMFLNVPKDFISKHPLKMINPQQVSGLSPIWQKSSAIFLHDYVSGLNQKSITRKCSQCHEAGHHWKECMQFMKNQGQLCKSCQQSHHPIILCLAKKLQLKNKNRNNKTTEVPTESSKKKGTPKNRPKERTSAPNKRRKNKPSTTPTPQSVAPGVVAAMVAPMVNNHQSTAHAQTPQGHVPNNNASAVSEGNATHSSTVIAPASNSPVNKIYLPTSIANSLATGSPTTTQLMQKSTDNYLVLYDVQADPSEAGFTTPIKITGKRGGSSQLLNNTPTISKATRISPYFKSDRNIVTTRCTFESPEEVAQQILEFRQNQEMDDYFQEELIVGRVCPPTQEPKPSAEDKTTKSHPGTQGKQSVKKKAQATIPSMMNPKPASTGQRSL